jgi:hypothetical protein
MQRVWGCCHPNMNISTLVFVAASFNNVNLYFHDSVSTFERCMGACTHKHFVDLSCSVTTTYLKTTFVK